MFYWCGLFSLLINLNSLKEQAAAYIQGLFSYSTATRQSCGIYINFVFWILHWSSTKIEYLWTQNVEVAGSRANWISWRFTARLTRRSWYILSSKTTASRRAHFVCLKPGGYYVHHLVQLSKFLRSFHRMNPRVLRGSQNREWLFPHRSVNYFGS